jgi:threonyl-tRNA synthetase
MDYAYEVKNALRAKGVRVEVDDRQEKIGKKIRDTELLKIPYMLIIGEKEMNEKQVSVRRQGKGDTGSVALADFVRDIHAEIINRQS